MIEWHWHLFKFVKFIIYLKLISQYTGYEKLNAINEAPPLLSNQWYYILNYEVWFLLLLKTKKK